MTDHQQVRIPSREAMIEDAIMGCPQALGFPEALAIRRCRVAEPCGLVDLILLPQDSPTQIVLVEAKSNLASDAASKVIGQLMMYYAGALMLGSEGLRLLRDFATANPDRARSLTRISPKALTGGLSPGGKAWAAMYAGDPLTPSSIQLYVAFDGEPHRAFRPTLDTLRQYHRMPMGLVLVENGAVKNVVHPTAV